MKAGQAALEWNPSEPIERAPDYKQPFTEEHDFLHIHNTADPMVPKAEPKGFFGFSKKKTEDKPEGDKSKPKEEGDKSGEEKMAKKAPVQQMLVQRLQKPMQISGTRMMKILTLLKPLQRKF